MNLNRLDQILDQFPSKRVLVVGDLMLDEFVWGRVSRISPEAPVPVVEVLRESYYPGGAANVARNVRECGTEAYVMGLIGEDSAGARLRKILEETGIRHEAIQIAAAEAFGLSRERLLARDRSPHLLHHLIRVNDPLTRHVAAALRPLLILDHDAGGTGVLERAHEMEHVDGVAIAGVAVEQRKDELLAGFPPGRRQQQRWDGDLRPARLGHVAGGHRCAPGPDSSSSSR